MCFLSIRCQEKMPKEAPVEERFETLANGFLLMTSKEHRFTTDSVLLADFAHPAKREHALDLCSGCGIVPALWFAWGEAPADAFALELREDAVRLMEGTVGKNGLHGRLCPVHLDLREPFTQAGGPRFDLVTCNPPYQSGGAAISAATRRARCSGMNPPVPWMMCWKRPEGRCALAGGFASATAPLG